MFHTVMQRKPIWYKRGTEYLKPPPGHEPVSSHVVTAKLLWGLVNINIVYGYFICYFQTKVYTRNVLLIGVVAAAFGAISVWRLAIGDADSVKFMLIFFKKYMYIHSFIHSFFIYIDLFIYFWLLVYDIFMYIYQNWRPVNRFGEFKSKFKRFSV